MKHVHVWPLRNLGAITGVLKRLGAAFTKWSMEPIYMAAFSPAFTPLCP